jgi:hypothetical protein
MSTISSSQNTSTSSTQSTSRNKSTASNANTTSAPVSKPESPKSENPTDRTSISNESRESSSSGGASLSLLDGLRDNYANSNSAVKETAKDKAGADDAKAKSPDQKLEDVKNTIDSLKGLKGEELAAKLEEIKKTDPELAAYLEKMLKEDDKTADDKKEVAEAKPAEKATGGGDDGAPSETFLWKPVSESDGKLVILLPTSISASSVSISGPSGSDTVQKGGRNGSRGNGQREHYRFDKSGKDMQGPVQVTVALENGGTKTINIAKPAERNEGGSLSDGQ